MADDAPSLPPSMQIDGAVARIWLRRPRQGNRIEAEDLPELNALFQHAAAEPGVRVLVLQSQGRHFCAGYDLSGLAAMTGGADHAMVENPFGLVVDALHAIDKPTIAALQGGVYGGGIDIALACDFRLGTQRCEMFMPALRIGLQHYASGLERYVSRLGLQNSKRIFFTGETFDAEGMLRIGVLDELHPGDDALQGAVDELAAKLAATAPLPMAGTKRALEQIAVGRLDRDQLRHIEHLAFRSNDLREGLAALRERRAPHFTGR